MQMGLAVGIDLGTTNSAVAVLDPYVVPNGDGDTTTPSTVCFRDGNVLVGAGGSSSGRWRRVSSG